MVETNGSANGKIYCEGVMFRVDRITSVDLSRKSDRYGMRPVNCHLHLPPANYSGLTDLYTMMGMAEEEGLRLLGFSNYYNYQMYEQLGKNCLDRGIFPLFGLEVIAIDHELKKKGECLNDPNNPGRVYLCGLGAPGLLAPSDWAGNVLREIISNDYQRMDAMAAKINQYVWSQGVDVQMDLAGIRYDIAHAVGCEPEEVPLQERHLANQLISQVINEVPDDFYATLGKLVGEVPQNVVGNHIAVQNLIRSKLLKAGGPCYADENFVDVSTALKLVAELGGLACYPMLLDRIGKNKPFTALEGNKGRLHEYLECRQISMVQLITLGNERAIAERYAEAMREGGLFVTTGTEHNTSDCPKLRPVCMDGQLGWQLSMLGWQGACIAAYHQTRVMQGLEAQRSYSEDDAYRGDALIHALTDSHP